MIEIKRNLKSCDACKNVKIGGLVCNKSAPTIKVGGLVCNKSAPSIKIAK